MKTYIDCEFKIGDLVKARKKTTFFYYTGTDHPIDVLLNDDYHPLDGGKWHPASDDHFGLVIDVNYYKNVGVLVKVLVDRIMCYAKPDKLVLVSRA